MGRRKHNYASYLWHYASLLSNKSKQALKLSQIKLERTRGSVVAFSFLTTPCRAASAERAVCSPKNEEKNGQGEEGDEGEERRAFSSPWQGAISFFRVCQQHARSRSLIAWFFGLKVHSKVGRIREKRLKRDEKTSTRETTRVRQAIRVNSW